MTALGSQYAPAALLSVAGPRRAGQGRTGWCSRRPTSTRPGSPVDTGDNGRAAVFLRAAGAIDQAGTFVARRPTGWPGSRLAEARGARPARLTEVRTDAADAHTGLLEGTTGRRRDRRSARPDRTCFVRSVVADVRSAGRRTVAT